MPELFGKFAEVYATWQQSGRIPNSMSQRVVTLVMKHPSSVLNSNKHKILAKVLAKLFALAAVNPVGKAQTFAIVGRKIQQASIISATL